MKKPEPVKKNKEDSIPFSFSKKGVNDEKIKRHWQKIIKKIGPGTEDKGKSELL